jgi:hypothetical protein
MYRIEKRMTVVVCSPSMNAHAQDQQQEKLKCIETSQSSLSNVSVEDPDDATRKEDPCEFDLHHPHRLFGCSLESMIPLLSTSSTAALQYWLILSPSYPLELVSYHLPVCGI